MLPVGIAADGSPPLDGIDQVSESQCPTVMHVTSTNCRTPTHVNSSSVVGWDHVQWSAITTGATSPRTEVLLNMKNSGGSTTIPGQGAIRIGKWKLMRGYTCNWGTASCGSCTARDEKVRPGIPYKNITADTSPPFCPNGWLPPPESATLPEPPPDVQCAGGLPCNYTASDYINGGTWLFDVEGI
eukprot:COSAG01_NODE_777_length_13689_cov_18.035467_15_plen_185_part_00